MKIGDLVNHNSSCFDDPWLNGIIVDTRGDVYMHDIEGPQKLTQHRVYWPGRSPRWIEAGLLEGTNESR
jgi:hypothetical protein